MARDYETLVDESRLLRIAGLDAKIIYIPYYEAGQEYDDLPIFVSPEDHDWIEDNGAVAFWDTAYTPWPNIKSNKNLHERDLTPFGYSSYGNAPLARVIACIALGIRREWLESFHVWPLDDSPLNCTRKNIMLQPHGSKLEDALCLFDLEMAVNEYGDYVRYDKERLFLMTRRLINGKTKVSTS